MAIIEKRNANLMNLIKRMHGVVENADIEKHRQSQNHFGALLGSSKDVLIEDVAGTGIAVIATGNMEAAQG